jgi:hypothetical protein
MASQILKNAASNLGLCLVFGLLAGMLFNNLALGVLGGLIGHLIIRGFYRRNNEEKEEG